LKDYTAVVRNVQSYKRLCDFDDVQMSTWDWAEVIRRPRDVWKSTTMDSGEQCAIICSPTWLPVLSATVLDSGLYCRHGYSYVII